MAQSPLGNIQGYIGICRIWGFGLRVQVRIQQFGTWGLAHSYYVVQVCKHMIVTYLDPQDKVMRVRIWHSKMFKLPDGLSEWRRQTL